MNIKKLGIEVSTDQKYKKLLRKCYAHAIGSNHPSTHNAALLVKNGKIILKGRNVLAPGVKEMKKRFEGENKHIYPNHAERDLIYRAAKKGIKTNKLSMVMPWLPCIPCANAVISAGISKLIIHKQMVERTSADWENELESAVQIMKEAGIGLVAFDGIVGAKAYMHSREWDA